jgi:hypothetical protein
MAQPDNDFALSISKNMIIGQANKVEQWLNKYTISP